MHVLPPFAELAEHEAPPLDQLCLALAGEFREVDATAAIAELDALGAELTAVAAGVREPDAQARACVAVLAEQHGFIGDARDYYDPRNSMLDAVLERRRGLPILLSVVYVEVARRAGIPLTPVGLPGHFVVGHLGVQPPVLLDPFAGGATLSEEFVQDGPPRAWGAHEIAMRVLNNLVGAFQRRSDIGSALKAASLRAELPAAPALQDALEVELRALRARLN